MNGTVFFKDRKEAGQLLARALNAYRNQNVVVYALPRGGVVVASEIARSLYAPLDLIITRKIGHPFSPEYAIGAIAEDGHCIFNESEKKEIDSAWLAKKIKEEKIEAKRRRNVYLGGKKHLYTKGEIAILVDDGVATGLTLMVGIIELNHLHPKKLVVAVPVIPAKLASTIRKEVDELVTISEPEYDSRAVGAYYQEFNSVEDDEVIRLLNFSKSA